MKKLKLFFALFAMLALGVGNAWGADVTYVFKDAADNPGNANDWLTADIDSYTSWSATKGGSNNPKYYSTGTGLRVYNGGKFTITSSKTLASITLTFSTTGYTFQSDNTTNPQTVTPNAKSYEWSVGRTCRLQKIEITYAADAGGETPDPTPDPDPDPEPDPDPTPGTGGTGTINFNSSAVKINAASVTGNDDLGNTWTITTVGTTSYTANNAYYQVGSGSKPATSITFTTTLPQEGTVTDFSAKFGGFSNTAGTVTLKVDDTSVGTGSLNGTSDVVVENSSEATGKTLTVTVTGIAKGVKVYYISYTYTTSGSGTEETVPSLTTDQFSWSATTATATLPNQFDEKPTLKNTEGLAVTYSTSNDKVATIDENGNVTLVGKGETIISATAGDDETYKKTTVSYTLTVKPAPLAPIAGGVIDILNQDWTDVTGTNYTDVAAKTAENEGHSNAQYVAQCAGDKSSIQLRSNNNNSGVVSTISGGIVKRVEVEWQNETAAGRILQVYGSNTAYEAATDLYSDDKKGELLGEITMGGDETVVDYSQWTGDYKYIGLRSKSGAMYLTTITITWLPINSKVTIDDAIQHGSISVSGATDLNAVAAGTELTLSNIPTTGYKLTAYDVYKTGEESTKVTETDGKFVMPEFDVTISATFELAKTLTGIEITTPATQTTFLQGEAFNYEGLKVTAHFEGAADEDVTDKVTVTGSTATAGEQTVTVSFTEGEVTKEVTYSITVKAIPNTKETAYTVADAYDIIDKLTTAEGVFIKGIVSQVDSYSSTYKSITYWISDDGTTTKQLQAYSGKGLESADFVDINGVSVEDQVIVCGDLKKHTDGTYEFNYNNYLVEHIKTTKADPELSYTPTEYNVNFGDAFTAPTLNNPHTLAVTYSSNNEDVATVATDGAVTIKAAGTVTITASFAGNENYVAGEASYTINVTDPSISEATFVAGTDKSEELSISKDGVTVEFTGGTFSRDDNYRCYANQSMTISYNDGQITKIVFTCDGSNYGPDKFSTETVTYSYSGSVGTWVGDAKSVTFAASSQVRMKDITVYYKQDHRQDAELAWSEETVTLTVGDAFTAPTFSNPNSVTGITFNSDNEALATVTNTGSISLVSGKTGTATITATYVGNETYKAAEVTCVITVSPKSEKVVILAQLEGQWYAMTGAYVTDKTNVLAAIPVEYINGTLYNVAETDKASIEWQRSMNGNKATFKNGDNYLTGGTSTDLTLKTTEFEWDYNGVNYLCNDDKRTFLYCENTKNNIYGFKNFAISNAGSVKNNSDGTKESYSSTPEVVAPVYATGTIYTRSELTEGNYGTICLPYASDNFTGATFFEVAGKEGNKIVFDEVTELEAGKPYIFLAEATEIKVAQIGTEELTAQRHNSLQGTFSQIDPAVDNVLVGNYMVVNNVIKKCGVNCGLKENRAYFVATELESLGVAPASAPGVRRISMGVTGQNTATGVDQVQGDNVPTKMLINGQLYILRGEKMYDTTGKLVK